MRYSILVSAALNLAVGLSLVACSSTDDPPAGPTGSGGTGGTAGSGGTAGTGGGGSGGMSGSGGAGGSGGSGTAMPCPQKFNYTGYTASTTAYTLAKDVYPIFQEFGCATAGVCHGAPKITPLMGSPIGTPTMMTLEAIRTDLLKTSVEAPALANVKPGDPENSYLMKKLDDSQNCEGLTCVKHPGAAAQNGCGAVMPLTVTTPIDAAKRKIIRDWIKQGAAL